MAEARDQEANETDVEIILAAVEFPTNRNELVDAAEGAKMDKKVVMFFEMLPDQNFSDRHEVDKAIDQKMSEHPDKSDHPED
jgi:hypothetical protein